MLHVTVEIQRERETGQFFFYIFENYITSRTNVYLHSQNTGKFTSFDMKIISHSYLFNVKKNHFKITYFFPNQSQELVCIFVYGKNEQLAATLSFSLQVFKFLEANFNPIKNIASNIFCIVNIVIKYFNFNR